MRRMDRTLAFVTLAAPLTAGSVLLDAEHKQALIERAVDDLLLRMEINIALRQNKETEAAGLRADAHRGVVTLSGAPAADPVSARAAKLAGSADGVTAVRLERH